MREIKFRGKPKDKTLGKWVYGNLIHNWYGTYIQVETDGYDDMGNFEPVLISYQVIPETVGQYIERKDKNGVEIFEGDIIEHDLTTYTYLGIVCFLTGYHISGFSVRWEGMGCSVRMETCKVIGNIHEPSEDNGKGSP